MFYIRVDGNSQIGAGHIMRCLSIAQALKEKGKVTIFITADEESARLISGKGFGTLSLQTDWKDMEGELDILLPVLKENGIKSLLIDSYSVTDRYLRKVGEKVKVILLDDLGEQCLPADILINYNIYAEGIGYAALYKKRVMSVPQLFLGCAYVPLRAEFQNVEGRVRRTVRDVLVTTGGADPCNAAGQIIAAIAAQGSKYRAVQFHVVSGTYNANAEKLKTLEKENLNVHVYQNVRHMSALMKKCDIAVAACGSTMYELAAMGVPTVCYYFAHNQSRIAESFGEKLAISAGNFAQEPEQTMNLIFKGIDAYLESYERRSRICEDLLKMLDGDGASRIADLLIEKKKDGKFCLEN